MYVGYCCQVLTKNWNGSTISAKLLNVTAQKSVQRFLNVLKDYPRM